MRAHHLSQAQPPPLSLKIKAILSFSLFCPTSQTVSAVARTNIGVCRFSGIAEALDFL
jgi:hypothetical protein